jgi:hypothetical protein
MMMILKILLLRLYSIGGDIVAPPIDISNFISKIN